MHAPLDDQALADLLPGTWTVAATNFPLWLSGEGREPRFSYELVEREPLVLASEVSYRTAEDEEKQVSARDTWRLDGFVRRGKGLQRLFASRWSVAGASEDRTVAVLRFAQSRAIPAGVEVVVREGTHHPELRAMVARATEQFGLSPEDFATLSWLAPAPRG